MSCTGPPWRGSTTNSGVPGGGVRRYQGDTYYGGGQWIPHTAALGCALYATHNPSPARQLLTWIKSTATTGGHLPEQVPDRVQSPHLLER